MLSRLNHFQRCILHYLCSQNLRNLWEFVYTYIQNSLYLLYPFQSKSKNSGPHHTPDTKQHKTITQEYVQCHKSFPCSIVEVCRLHHLYYEWCVPLAYNYFAVYVITLILGNPQICAWCGPIVKV